MNDQRTALTDALNMVASPPVGAVCFRTEAELYQHRIEDKAEDDMNRMILGMPGKPCFRGHNGN